MKQHLIINDGPTVCVGAVCPVKCWGLFTTQRLFATLSRWRTLVGPGNANPVLQLTFIQSILNGVWTYNRLPVEFRLGYNSVRLKFGTTKPY